MNIYSYMQSGMEFVITNLLFIFGGYKLDSFLDTYPTFFFIGMPLGFAISLFRLLQKTNG